MHVEQDGAGHDDEAVGVAVLELLEGEGHEVPAHNVTKTRREGERGGDVEEGAVYSKPAAIPATNRVTIKGWDQHTAHLLFST